MVFHYSPLNLSLRARVEAVVVVVEQINHRLTRCLFASLSVSRGIGVCELVVLYMLIFDSLPAVEFSLSLSMLLTNVLMNECVSTCNVLL